MTSPTHIVIGLSAAFGLARVNGIALNVFDIIFVLIGSLAPDLDADGGAIARPGKILRNFLPRGIANMIDNIFELLTKIINRVFGHRGPLHWPIIGITLYVLGICLSKDWLMWFGWGYLWHILADFCTKKGVPLFGPIKTEFIGWSSLRTGSPFEALIFISFLCLTLILGWPLLPVPTRYWLEHYYEFLSRRV